MRLGVKQAERVRVQLQAIGEKGKPVGSSKTFTVYDATLEELQELFVNAISAALSDKEGG